MASYHTQFASEISDNAAPFKEWRKALYLTLPAPSKLLCLIRQGSDCLVCHHLAVETGGWYGVHRDDRKCTLCTTGSVQDELHVLFVCSALSPLRVRIVLYYSKKTASTMCRNCFKWTGVGTVLVIGVWCWAGETGLPQPMSLYTCCPVGGIFPTRTAQLQADDMQVMD
jgi:hypothetical protein